MIVGVLAGWGSLVFAREAATLIDPGGPPPATDYAANNSGWRFTVNQEITITHVGILDLDEPGLSQPHVIGLWKNPRKGFEQLCSVVISGQDGELVGHYRYVPLDPPITLRPDTAPPLLHTDGYLYIDRYLLGVWSPPGSTDRIKITDRNAVSITEAITLGGTPSPPYPPNFTYQVYRTIPPLDGPQPPWGGGSDYEHFAVNFKYTVPGAPTADAGPEVAIYTSEQAVTTVMGVAYHTNPEASLEYRWLEGETELQTWTAVGLFGAASLNLAAPVPALPIGPHTLTLEVSDGMLTASDTMTLTVSNTPPEAQLAPTSQVVEISLDEICLTAEVADFDGDELSYQWRKGEMELASGTIDTPADGSVVPLTELVIPANDPRFLLGIHEIQLVVQDGTNPPLTLTATVEVKDTTSPTLAPLASTTMLWPPNGSLRPVTIWAHAIDNGGGLITLTVNVQSNETESCCGHCSRCTQPDWYIDAINNDTGEIQLRLRAERSGRGDGRIYTITVTATDQSMNQSSAAVEVRVPHDRRKK